MLLIKKIKKKRRGYLNSKIMWARMGSLRFCNSQWVVHV
jgi:hypothetical protein